MNNDIYYRPEWTCGKYNATKHVAIMFNLLANGEYFFEHESADVVGLILAAGRNGKVSVSQVSASLNISPKSIIPFFGSLIEIGLLSETFPTNEVISSYRKQCASQSNATTYIGENAESYLQCEISSVEQAYDSAVESCTEITNAVFELTYRCSEKCLHCYNPGATRNDEEKSGRNAFSELALDDYKRIIDEMCELGLATVTLTGGDPFAYKEVWEILEYLYQKDIAVTILTNGQQLVNQIEHLCNLYPRSVKVSLYGADPIAHDSITRKKGSWQTTLDVIMDLRKVAVPVVINCVIMRPGLKSYMDLKKIGEDLSCLVLFDFGVVDSIDGDICATHHLRLTPEELELVLMDPDIEPKTDNFDMSANPAPAPKGVPCLAGRGTFCVMPDGKIIPCVSMHMVLGDLKRQDFHSIIVDNSKLKGLLEAKATDYIECGSHDYCNSCIFCAGNSFAEHGNPLQANENNCYLAKNKYALMTKLKSGIDVLKGKTLRECINAIPDYVIPSLKREYKKGK